jgi:D-tyrosyl-tRNA(Tyr) deacylase
MTIIFTLMTLREIIDQKPQVDKMINKLLAYRVFADEQGKMNLSVADINGGVLVVSQFTLVADTKSGTRAGFSTAKSPVLAEVLYDYFLSSIKLTHATVALLIILSTCGF